MENFAPGFLCGAHDDGDVHDFGCFGPEASEILHFSAEMQKAASPRRAKGADAEASAPLRLCERSADREEVDDEDQGLAAEEVPAGRPVGEVRGDHELAASADLHARDAVLPPLDEAAERELDALAAVPRGIELFAGLVLDT